MINRKRSKQLLVRLTDDELSNVKRRVEASGLTQQGYLLRAILNQPIMNTDSLKEFIPQLRRIGVNLNQLTKLANSGCPVYRSDFKPIQEEFDALCQSLKRFTPKQS